MYRMYGTTGKILKTLNNCNAKGSRPPGPEPFFAPAGRGAHRAAPKQPPIAHFFDFPIFYAQNSRFHADKCVKIPTFQFFTRKYRGFMQIIA